MAPDTSKVLHNRYALDYSLFRAHFFHQSTFLFFSLPSPLRLSPSLQVHNLVRQRFPDLTISTATHPPPPTKAAIARIASMIQIFFIIFFLAGDQLAAQFPILNTIIPPRFFNDLREKKMAFVMGTWFVGNMFIGSLTNTGAFEITYNDTILHSKLATGQMPDVNALVAAIQEAIDASG